jgi:hypothetical protein
MREVQGKNVELEEKMGDVEEGDNRMVVHKG